MLLYTHIKLTNNNFTKTIIHINAFYTKKQYYPAGADFIKNGGADTYYIESFEYYQFISGLSQQPAVVIIQIECGVETYYYSVYDVLDIINKQYKKTTTMHSNNDLFILPTSGDFYNLLTNTISPNFTFTQSTYFEAIQEVFQLFDAIFTLDENKNLGIEYLNQRKEVVNPDFKGLSQSISEEKYNNGLVNYYQRAIQKVRFPSYDDGDEPKNFSPIRSTVLGVPQQDTFAY